MSGAGAVGEIGVLVDGFTTVFPLGRVVVVFDGFVVFLEVVFLFVFFLEELEILEFFLVLESGATVL